MSRWSFPLRGWKGEVPTGTHPGAFGARRKHDIHTGVDLYTAGTAQVRTVEAGIVVNIEEYTGANAGSPWWLPTKAILIKGKTGVVCYGEVQPEHVVTGKTVDKGIVIGHVAPVLPQGKVRRDIPGHSRFMLHLELYDHQTTESVWWHLNEDKPANLLDPTSFLLDSLKTA